MTNDVDIRRLIPGDEEAVDRFLVPLTSSSMFLRSNMRRAGLEYRGEPFQGVYIGLFQGGRLEGVAAHYWNGNVMLQAPGGAADLAAALVRESALPFKGLLGPQDQVDEVRETLELHDAPAQSLNRETLFELPLHRMKIPAALETGAVVCRRSREGDFDRLLEWRTRYSAETLNEPDTPETRAANKATIERNYASGHQFVLTANGEAVATSTFNAVLDDIVQIGGVWTPPDLRGHGYGRAVVGGSLTMAQAEGKTKAILFTQNDNIAAQRAYTGLGFEHVGEYGLVLFGKDLRPMLGNVLGFSEGWLRRG